MATIPHPVLLAAIRQCVTVVEPGEILAVRLPLDMDLEAADQMAEQAERIGEQSGVQLLFVFGEEFARLKAGEAP